jgi:hypothetical protein
VFVSARYSKEEAGAAVAVSQSFSEALRRLGMRPAGSNFRMLRKRLETWGISVGHFDPYAASRARQRRSPIPLEQILVRGSTYRRHLLKERLYTEGLKRRACEICGQGEHWNGRRMSLILDHVNGVADDNRFENLRIVCPNCAATLDTHCGRNKRTLGERECARCGTMFMPKYNSHRYCSRCCALHRMRERGHSRPDSRRVERPSYEQLLEEVGQLGYVGTGRRYGVSDNAIRKWLRTYEIRRLAASE